MKRFGADFLFPDNNTSLAVILAKPYIKLKAPKALTSLSYLTFFSLFIIKPSIVFQKKQSIVHELINQSDPNMYASMLSFFIHRNKMYACSLAFFDHENQSAFYCILHFILLYSLSLLIPPANILSKPQLPLN